MSELRDQSIEYIRHNLPGFLENLSALLRIPSISTSPDNIGDMVLAAQAVANLLVKAGVDKPQIIPTPGHPIVCGEWLGAGPNAKTVLIYGHYDVQPVDPLDLWKNGPFVPTENGQYLYARGASDMKGQIVAALAAVEAVVKTGKSPVNFKFLIEGEEEIGSPNLKPFIKEYKDALKSDFALNPDAGMISATVPTIVYSLRGLAFFEIKIIGPDHDLHSGSFGGVVHNPAVALSQIIAGMHDENGTITLPGFYDNVRQISQREHEELVKLPMNDEFFISQTGAPLIWGEKEYLPVERVGARPTLEVNGMISGYTGAGTKTVLPSYALAKISTRLVANQNPEEIYRAMKAYLKANMPPTVRYELTFLGGSPACATDPFSPAAQSLAKAMELVWETSPVYKCEGGSIPVVADMQQILGIDSVLTGFGLPDDCIHSPNERLHLPTWYKGMEALTHFFWNLE